MGVVSHDTVIAFSIPPAKLFRALFLDGDTLIPKALPQALKSVEFLRGNGGAGTIKLLTFGEGSLSKSVKQRVDEVDKENFVYKYSIIEGDAFMGVLESVSYVVKLEASGDGCVCKISSKFHSQGNAQIKEEDIKSGEEKATAMFKAIEAYLHANPDY